MSEALSKVSPNLGDMPCDDFRKHGHELIDWIADYLDDIEELPVMAQIQPGDLTGATSQRATRDGRIDGRNHRRS